MVERAAIAAVIPPEPSTDIRSAEKELARLRRQREDLEAGGSVFPTTD